MLFFLLEDSGTKIKDRHLLEFLMVMQCSAVKNNHHKLLRFLSLKKPLRRTGTLSLSSIGPNPADKMQHLAKSPSG